MRAKFSIICFLFGLTVLSLAANPDGSVGHLLDCDAALNIDGSTQLEMLFIDIQQQSRDSICGNYDDAIQSQYNLPINCFQSNGFLLVGVEVPTNIATDTNNAFLNAFSIFQNTMQGHIAPFTGSSISCISEIVSLPSTKKREVTSSDSTLSRPHTPSQLTRTKLGKRDQINIGTPITFQGASYVVVGVKTFVNALASLPPAQLPSTSFGDLADALGNTGRSIGLKAAQIGTGVQAVVTFDTGAQVPGFPTVNIQPADWFTLLENMLQTLATVPGQTAISIKLKNAADTTGTIAANIVMFLTQTNGLNGQTP
jgi:hypothetical protein